MDCEEKRIADGWERGVALADIPTAQLGTGTIVNDTWYLPVSYDYQILPNAYMSYNGGWSISAQNLSWEYDTTNYTGLHFETIGPNGGIAQMISNSQTMPINVNVEDIWADFTIQFGSDTSAQMMNMNAKMYIKAETESEWLLLGELTEPQIPIGEPKELSVNCTRQLQQAGMGGDKLYQLKLEFSFDGATANEVIVKKAEVYKNNMFVKKIANLSTTTEPTAETMIDFHTYSGAIDGGRSGQLNTPMLYDNGYLYFGNWTRPDANGNNYAKYFKLNASNNQLTTLNTGHTDDGFYLAGSTIFNSGAKRYVAFGSDNGNLYLFNADTGTLLNTANVQSLIRSSICYDSGGLYFTTKSGFLYKYMVNSESRLVRSWEKNLALPSNATPTVSGEIVYVSVGEFTSTDGKLYAFDALDGTPVGNSYSTGGPVQSSMLIYEPEEGSVFAYYTVNKATGKGYCQYFDYPTPTAAEIGEAGYTLQGFAAANGYLVYGNDGVPDEEYNYKVCVYIAY